MEEKVLNCCDYSCIEGNSTSSDSTGSSSNSLNHHLNCKTKSDFDYDKIESIIEELGNVFEDRITAIDCKSCGDSKLKVGVYEEWVGILIQLVKKMLQALGDLEAQATNQVGLLETKLNCELKSEEKTPTVCDFQDDISNLLVLLRRVIEDGKCDLNGIEFKTINGKDIYCEKIEKNQTEQNLKEKYGIIGHESARKSVANIQFLGKELSHQDNLLKEKSEEIERLRKHIEILNKKMEKKEQIEHYSSVFAEFPRLSSGSAMLYKPTENQINQCNQKPPMNFKIDFKNKEACELAEQDLNYIEMLQKELESFSKIQHNNNDKQSEFNSKLTSINDAFNEICSTVIKLRCKLKYIKNQLKNILEDKELMNEEDPGYISQEDVDPEKTILTDIKKRFKCLRDTNYSLREENKSLREEISDIDYANTKHIEKISMLAEKTRLKKQVDGQLLNLSGQEESFQSIRSQQCDNGKITLCDAIQKLERSLRERDEDSEKMTEITCEMNQELQLTNKKLSFSQTEKEEKEDLIRKLDRKSQTIAELNTRSNGLMCSLTQSENTNEELKNHIKSMEEFLDIYKSKLDNLSECYKTVLDGQESILSESVSSQKYECLIQLLNDKNIELKYNEDCSYIEREKLLRKIDMLEKENKEILWALNETENFDQQNKIKEGASCIQAEISNLKLHLENQKSKFSKKINAVTEERDILVKEIVKLEKENKELLWALNEAQDKSNIEEDIVSQYKDKIKYLEQNLAQEKKIREGASFIQTEITNLKLHLENQKSLFSKKINAVTEERDILVKEIVKLEKENKELLWALNEAQDKLNIEEGQYKDKIKYLEQNLAQEKKIREGASCMQAEISNLKLHLENQKCVFSKKINAVTEERDILLWEIVELKKENKELLWALNEAEDKSNIEEDVNQYKEKIKYLEQNLAQEKKKIKEGTSCIQTEISNLTLHLENQKCLFSRKINTVTQERDKLLKEIVELKKENTELLWSLNEAEDKSNIEEDASQYKDKMENLQQNLVQEKKIKEGTSFIEAEISNLKLHLENQKCLFSKKINQVTEERDNLLKEINKLEIENKELLWALNEAEDKSKIEEEVNQYKNKIKCLQQNLAKEKRTQEDQATCIQDEINNLKQQMEDQKSLYSKQTNAIIEVRDELLEEIVKLEKENKELLWAVNESNKSNFEEDANQYKDKIKFLQQNLEKEKKIKEDQASCIQVEITNLKQQLENQKSLFSKQTNAVTELEEQIAYCKVEKCGYKTENAILAAEVLTLNENLALSEKKLHFFESRLKTYEKRNRRS